MKGSGRRSRDFQQLGKVQVKVPQLQALRASEPSRFQSHAALTGVLWNFGLGIRRGENRLERSNIAGVRGQRHDGVLSSKARGERLAAGLVLREDADDVQHSAGMFGRAGRVGQLRNRGIELTADSAPLGRAKPLLQLGLNLPDGGQDESRRLNRRIGQVSSWTAQVSHGSYGGGWAKVLVESVGCFSPTHRPWPSRQRSPSMGPSLAGPVCRSLDDRALWSRDMEVRVTSTQPSPRAGSDSRSPARTTTSRSRRWRTRKPNERVR